MSIKLKPLNIFSIAVLVALLLYAIVTGYFLLRINNTYSEYKVTLAKLLEVGTEVDENLVAYEPPLSPFPWELQRSLISLESDSAKLYELLQQEHNELVATAKDNLTVLSDYNQTLNKLDLPTSEIVAGDNLEKLDTKGLYDYTVEQLTEIENSKIQIEAKINELKTKGKPYNPLWLVTDSKIKEYVAGLSPEQKAGQLLMIVAQGQTLSEKYAQRLRTISPGGVILMGANVSTPEGTANFVRQIQTTNGTIPLFIATDQEGGLVKRVPWDATEGQKAWDKLNSEQVCAIGKQRSKTLKQIGVNINFAPVVDLSNPEHNAFINNRTISPDPRKVTELAQAFVRCSQSEGVMATLKHYPGHGATVEDSHIVLPKISKSKADWLTSDGLPFKEIGESKLVMVGHLEFENIDPDVPSSLSHKLLTEILREEFGYEGLIITDAMGQLHGSTGISVKDALKKSINAGVDIVLYVSVPTSEEDIYAQLVELIKSGEINETRVNESVSRIIKIKKKL